MRTRHFCLSLLLTIAWSGCSCVDRAAGDAGADAYNGSVDASTDVGVADVAPGDTAGRDGALPDAPLSDREGADLASADLQPLDTSPPSDGPEPYECDVPRDCGAGFDCVDHRCVRLFCEDDSHCDQAAGEHCDTLRGLCTLGSCSPGDPDACPPGQLCLGGSCGDPPPPAAACQIWPHRAVVGAGHTVELAALGRSGTGDLTPFALFDWSAAPAACVTVDADSGTVTAPVSVSAPCTATVTATPVGGSPCTAEVVAYPPVTLPALRAIAVDALSGAPLPEVTVAVRIQTGSGQPVVELEAAVTDADGVAEIADIGTAQLAHILDVSLFHPDYTWVTAVRPRSSDLLFALHRSLGDQTMAGVEGALDFSPVTRPGDIRMGVGGLSQPGGLLELNLYRMLVGAIDYVDVSIEGIGNFEDLALPATLQYGLGTTSIKGSVAAFSVPGERLVWGLGGKLRLGEISSYFELFGASIFGGPHSFHTMLMPVFGQGFSHSLQPAVALVEMPRPQDGSATESWDFGVASQRLPLDQQLVHTFAWSVAALPAMPGPDDDLARGVFGLVGVAVPGMGLVPLGTSTGYDAPSPAAVVDGVIDPIPCESIALPCARPARGEMWVHAAPPHHGLEGLPGVVLLRAPGVGMPGERDMSSFLYQVVDVLDPEEPDPFAAASFLSYATTARYVPGVRFTQDDAVPGVSLYRLRLSHAGRSWDLYFEAPNLSIDLPPTPDGMEARITTARVQGISLSSDLTLDELFAVSGLMQGGLDRRIVAGVSAGCRAVEEPTLSCDAGYWPDDATLLCVGGPDDISAFPAGTELPCADRPGYAPRFLLGPKSRGICVRVPACLQE